MATPSNSKHNSRLHLCSSSPQALAMPLVMALQPQQAAACNMAQLSTRSLVLVLQAVLMANQLPQVQVATPRLAQPRLEATVLVPSSMRAMVQAQARAQQGPSKVRQPMANPAQDLAIPTSQDLQAVAVAALTATSQLDTAQVVGHTAVQHLAPSLPR